MKPLNVLVVEDALDHAFLVMEFLKELGVNVTHAQDGDRAIQLFDAQYFDLVLTDLNLPGTDGFQVIEHVKSRRPALPVLAVTGYDKPEYDERAFQAGVDAILHRPLDKDEVLRQVRNLLPDLGDDEERAPAVLAVGALPGDVEAGCGGTLLKHGMDGYEVTVLVLSSTVEEEGDAVDEALHRGAEVLGARLVAAEPVLQEPDSARDVQLFIEQVARRVKPEIAYVPSVHDDHEERRKVHRLSRVPLAGVPEVRGYATDTTAQHFRATVFEDVTETMLSKLEALAAYRDASTSRPDLVPRFAQACARYWGRFAGFRDTEPFEILHGRSAEPSP